MVPIVSFVGKHNSGKTRLLTEIIKGFSHRGIAVAIIKHAQEVNVIGNKDSDLLFTSGAKVAYTSSQDISITYTRQKKEKSLEEIYAKIASEVDLVITEGYKTEVNPKIEVLRKEISTMPMDLSNVIARVADFRLVTDVPVFGFDQVEEIISYLVSNLKLKPQE